LHKITFEEIILIMKKLLVLFLLVPFVSFAQNLNLNLNIEFQISGTNGTTCGGPGNLVTADFNHDGRADIAVANNDENGGCVNVLLGTGDSTFYTNNSFSVLYPQSIVTGYFDADTNADIAVATTYYQNYYVSIYVGAGDGLTFTSTDTTYLLGGPPKWMITADFNNDSIPDLATVSSTSITPGTFSILQGVPGGGFLPAITYNAGTYPSSLTSGDFNGDKYIDIAITNLGDNNVNVFLFDLTDNSSGQYMQFSSPAIYPTGVNPWSIISADLNNDHFLDLAVGNSGDATINIILNNPDSVGTFLPTISDTIGGNVWSVIASDFNLDGDSDLAITSRDSGLTILQGIGNAYFIKTWNLNDTLLNYTALYSPQYLIAQDLNSDGLPDLSVSDHTRNFVMVLSDTIINHPPPTAVIPPLSTISSTVKVYPIPATQIINVDCKYPIEALSLCDIQGRVLMTSKQSFLTIASLPAGMYLLYITTQWGTVVKQVIVASQ